jgi:hypothetical protein
MTSDELAHYAEALTFVIATITLIVALIDRNRVERREELRKWQRLNIYELVVSGPIDFAEIKAGYLQAAQTSLKPIARKDIQDDEMRLAILSLIEAKLIALRSDNKYVPYVVSDSDEVLRKNFMATMLARENRDRVSAQVVRKLETESGKYTPHQLSDMVELGQMDFAEFNLLITSMWAYGPLFIAQDGKLWLKNKLPQQNAPQPSPR